MDSVHHLSGVYVSEDGHRVADRRRACDGAPVTGWRVTSADAVTCPACREIMEAR